jgi:hypothetical protein
MAQHMHAEHAVAAAIQSTLKVAYDEGQGALLMPDLVDLIAQRSH